MKIALLGFGGMGRVVQRIALERNHEVPIIVDPHTHEATHKILIFDGNGQNGRISSGESANSSLAGKMIRLKYDEDQILRPEDLKDVDVVVDFSLGEAVLENVRACADAGVNLVVGTTGWYERMDEVRALVEGGQFKMGEEEERGEQRLGLLWSSNFSIGVNMYFKMVEAAAKMIDKFEEYDVWGHEIHHSNKADSPSGTAKTLEEILLSNIQRKTAVVEDRLNRRRAENEIHFSSVRGGMVNFGHTIGFDSAADTITISHVARSRDGYALGAVKAAEWLQGRKGFFGMEDFLKS